MAEIKPKMTPLSFLCILLKIDIVRLFVRNRAQNYIKILIGTRFFAKKFITLQLQSNCENVLRLGITQASLVLRSACDIFANELGVISVDRRL